MIIQGRMVKCGNCYPEFPNCSELEKEHGDAFKCDCYCHDENLRSKKQILLNRFDDVKGSLQDIDSTLRILFEDGLDEYAEEMLKERMRQVEQLIQQSFDEVIAKRLMSGFKKLKDD